jgi:hypothetical protein
MIFASDTTDRKEIQGMIISMKLFAIRLENAETAIVSATRQGF